MQLSKQKREKWQKGAVGLLCAQLAPRAGVWGLCLCRSRGGDEARAPKSVWLVPKRWQGGLSGEQSLSRGGRTWLTGALQDAGLCGGQSY